MAQLNTDTDEEIEVKVKNLKISENRREYKPNLRNESSHLLGFFPEEVWIMITERITGAKDVENLHNSSPFFQTLLETQRVQFLFPQVWQLIEDIYTKLCEKEFGRAKFKATDEIVCECGKDRKVCAFSSILELRLVCKTWRDALDSFYQSQNHTLSFQMQHDEKSEVTDSKYKWTREEFGSFTISNEMEEFLHHFGESHGNGERNPFIGKSVNLFYGGLEGPAQHAEISRLLSNYGKHVEYCVINSGIGYVVDESYMAYFCDWLQSMPNLRSLKVKFGELVRPWRGGINRHLVHHHPANLDDFPMPTLDNLKFLSAEAVPTPILNQILHKNSHISMLNINRCTENRFEILDIPVHMPNLTQFSIAGHTEREFRNLENPAVNWPLKKFYFDFNSSRNFDWGRLFNLVERKWANSLTDLMLQLPAEGNCEERNRMTELYIPLRLNLPFLKRFKVLLGNYTTLDFILPMDELEGLEVKIEFNERLCRMDENIELVEREQIMRFIGYTNRMLESNIWTLLPKLQWIKIIHEYNPRSGKMLQSEAERNTCTWKYRRQEWQTNLEQ